MLHFAVKNLLSYKLRTLLVSLAIVMGVSFVAGTLILTDSIRQGFNTLFEDTYSQIDFIIKPADSLYQRPSSVGVDEECHPQDNSQQGSNSCLNQPFDPAQLPLLDEALAQRLRAVAGVAIVEPLVEGQVLLTDLSGEPIWEGPFGGLGSAVSWPTQAGISALSLVPDTGSRAPETSQEIAVDQATAQRHNLKVGDKVKVESSRFTQPAQEVTIVGLATFGTNQQLDTFVAFSLAEAQRFFEVEGSYMEIYVQADDGIDQLALQAALEQVTPVGFEVLTAEQRVNDQLVEIQTGLFFVASFLLIFAGIAIFVAIFVIQNTFRMILGQRTRELALLRIIGASKRQIRKIVSSEALLIGILGSLLGLVVGIGLAALTRSLLGDSIPIQTNALVIKPATIIVSLFVGSSVATFSAFLPAIKASRVSPLEALGAIETPPTAKTSLIRTIIGAIVGGLGGASLAYGLAGATGSGILVFTGFGAVLMFIGVAILAPVLCRPIAYLLAKPLIAVFAMPAKLAHANIRRQPRQVAAAASTLMIGVSLIVLVTVLAGSFKATVQDVIDDTFPADITIYSRSLSSVPNQDEDQATEGIVPIAVLDGLNGLADVKDVTAVRYSFSHVQLQKTGQSIDLAGVDTANLEDVIKLKFSRGAITNLGMGQLVVKEKVASDQDWQLGDTITFNFKDNIRSYQLGGTFEELFDTNFILSSQSYLKLIDDRVVTYIVANAADGVETYQAVESVKSLLADYSSLSVYDKEDLITESEKAIDATLSTFRGLLGLSLIIAIFGIVNTLFLAVVERTRELGLLRAVGITRRQLRSMIRVEAIIIAVFGACLGTALGLTFGWAIVRAISASQGTISFVMPLTEIGIYLLLAILAGILASVWPAFKASRLDILKAISHQ